jgi:hypothetical protein
MILRVQLASVALAACAAGIRPVELPPTAVSRDPATPIHDRAVQTLIDKLPRVVSDEPAALPVMTDTVLAGVVPAFYEAARRLVATPASSIACDGTCPQLAAAADEVEARARDVNAALANAKLGYYFVLRVSSDDTGARVYWFPFVVERVISVEADGGPRRVLELRAWNQLYLSGALGKQFRGALGVTFDGTPTVLLDNVEASAPRLIGILHHEPPPPPFSHLAPTFAAIRADLVRALGNDPARITDLLAHEIALHEAQHASDHDRTTSLVHPTALVAMIPDDHHGVIEHATLELSAYLGELAREHVLAHDVLWDAVWPALAGHDAPLENVYAGAVMIRELARYFGELDDEPDTIDPARLSELTNRLAAHTGSELAAAATAVWQLLYGVTPMAPTTSSVPSPTRNRP